MAKATGTVIERRWKRGKGFALRFCAYGKRRYLTLGFDDEGSRGEPEAHEMPTFGLFARGLVAGRPQGRS